MLVEGIAGFPMSVFRQIQQLPCLERVWGPGLLIAVVVEVNLNVISSMMLVHPV